MTWRVLLEGGPLAGKQATFERENFYLGDTRDDWPPAFDHPGGGRYVLARREPVPFDMGDHPNVLLTAHYAWEGTT